VLLFHLHALGRDDPYPLREIDLVPTRTNDLASARRRQDCELECAGRDAVLLAQLSHEGADLAIWQCWVVLDAMDLRYRPHRMVHARQPWLTMEELVAGLLSSHRPPSPSGSPIEF
jgi:hypothetical protein